MSQRSSFLALGFSSVGHLFTHLLMLLYPTVVIALEGRWGLSYGELLALATPGFVLYGLAALPAGWFGDRWSAEQMMVLFFVGSGLSAIATGLAQGPWGLGLGLAAIGFFGSIYHPVGIAWLIRHAENRGRAIGWNGIFGSLGLGIAALVAGALTEWISWRAAFIVPGALCLATGIALMLCMRSGTVVAATADRRPEPQVDRSDAIRVFIVLSVTMLGTGLIGQVLQVAMPKIFVDGLPGLAGRGVLGAGGFVTVVFTISAATQLLGGWLADRYPTKPLYILCFAGQIPVFLLAAGLLDAPLVLAMTAVAVLGTMGGTAENVILARFTPARWRSTAFGAKFVIALGVSAAGVPLVGWSYDATGGFAQLFLVLAGTTFATAAAAFFLPGTRRAPLQAATQPAE
jgi:MFS family permease